MGDESTRTAYGARAAEYIRILGSVEDMHELDQQLIARWSASINGQIIDAGCGPGHWTSYLHGQGATIEGIDLVPEFIKDARRRLPEVPFRLGSFIAMESSDRIASGVLAWYSLIHISPDDVPLALREFARILVPGGHLLIGFFDGLPRTPFPHAVTTAYYWSVEQMERLLNEAGFDVLEVETRHDSGKRAHAAISAVVR